MDYAATSVVQMISDVFLRLDQDGTILGYKASDKYPPFLTQDALGKSIRDYFTASFAEEFQEYYRQTLESMEAHTWEYSIQGSRLLHYQEATMFPLGLNEVGIAIKDISDRRWSEEALRKSEHLYRHMIQNLQVGIIIFTPGGEILSCNQIGLQLLGISEERLLGSDLRHLKLDLIAEGVSTREDTANHIYKTVVSGATLHNLLIYRDSLQTSYRTCFALNIVPERDEGGAIQYVVATITDITDFKNAEAALYASEEQYARLLNSIHEVIFLIDLDGSWVFLNSAWQEYTGYSPYESMGQQWIDYIEPCDRERVQSLLVDGFTDDSNSVRHEIRLTGQNNQPRWVEMRLRPVLNDDGQVTGYSGTFIDINERKLNQEQAFRLEVQSRLLELQRQLTVNVSHDMRTPLSVILTSAHLLKRKLPESPAYLGHVDTIQQQAHLLSTSLDKALSMAHLLHGGVEYSFVPINVEDVVKEVVRRFQQVITERGLLMKLEIEESLPFILADHAWIMKTFENLLDNAIKFTASGGTVLINASSNEDSITIEIVDTGIGISSEELPNVFETFYKGDKSRSGVSGISGIGLTVVKAVVEAHHGSVTIESIEGVGTTCRVVLPAAVVEQRKLIG
ncbi:MAG: PAS domain-containing sensor histidine kinase [Anaerolineae bacterium]|nr:PAS domain-containing sensor histidine kinase [Anaerolineae bacterium]